MARAAVSPHLYIILSDLRVQCCHVFPHLYIILSDVHVQFCHVSPHLYFILSDIHVQCCHVSLHLYFILSDIHVQCYPPLRQLHIDFRDFSSGVSHVMKITHFLFVIEILTKDP